MEGTFSLRQLENLPVLSIARQPVPLGKREGVQPLVLQLRKLRASEELIPKPTLLEATFPVGVPYSHAEQNSSPHSPYGQMGTWGRAAVSYSGLTGDVIPGQEQPGSGRLLQASSLAPFLGLAPHSRTPKCN